MVAMNYMNKSSVRGICLSITLLFSIALVTVTPNVYAEITLESSSSTVSDLNSIIQGVNIKSFALEETVIIEFTNDSDMVINTVRIWLEGDASFKSFKTEEGWFGEKTQSGVIIFTSSKAINPGESVKFGIKTDKARAVINWETTDKRGVQTDIGTVFPEELPGVIEDMESKEQISDSDDAGISTESTFRIVPKKPNVGSSIRVTGDKFAASQEFDFYIDSQKIGSFQTDENGHFMTTMKIPEEQESGRVDFKVKDKKGEEKRYSVKIEEIDNRIPEQQIVILTIKGIPDVVHRGDFLEIFGTGDPGSAITAKISNSEGEIINSRTAEIDSKGNWKLDEPIIIPLDTPFGAYSATITDGKQDILKHWTVKSDKVIIIAPSNLKFEPGETMKFNGTALPNKSVYMILEDPLGKEIFTDIVQTDDSGFIEFEFPTSQSITAGTYTLIATQGKEKEFIFAGIGQLPTIPVNLEFDKLNYKAGETARISLIGKGSDIVSLLIIDPFGKIKGDATSITLQPDGRGIHSLNLEGYASGSYTAVISKGSAQRSETFTVGLEMGTGKIEIKTTKLEYLPGDPILILGDTSKNSLLTVTLVDPDGEEIVSKEIFSDKNGKISESSFRVPSTAEIGTWVIKVQSGTNLDDAKIEVLATTYEGMQISVEEGMEIQGFKKAIVIKVTGAQQTVEIKIGKDGKIIENLSFPASSQGEINQPWGIPPGTEPGVYTVNATDAFDSAETTFELEQ